MSHYIFNIPHASTNIPFKEGFIGELYKKEVALLTDHATDIIFDVPEMSRMVCPFSRVFCDVERFHDHREVMEKYGMGVFYTHTDDGRLMRELSEDKKKLFLAAYYFNYHTKFENMIAEKLKVHKRATIIDCHSFSNIPFQRDLDKTSDRPDICIGTDVYHTPLELELDLVYYFQKQGFRVSVNSPYTGSIVPHKYYHKYHFNVKSVMIEVNRDLYMKEGRVLKRKCAELRKIISGYFV